MFSIESPPWRPRRRTRAGLPFLRRVRVYFLKSSNWNKFNQIPKTSLNGNICVDDKAHMVIPGPLVKATASMSAGETPASSSASLNTVSTQPLWCNAVSRGMKPSPGGALYVLRGLLSTWRVSCMFNCTDFPAYSDTGYTDTPVRGQPDSMSIFRIYSQFSLSVYWGSEHGKFWNSTSH